MLTVQQRRDLLLAERSHDPVAIREALKVILLDNKTATLLDCEMALRESGAKTFLVISQGKLEICGSSPEMLAALKAGGSNLAQNLNALAESGP
jgi:hypothetical protein